MNWTISKRLFVLTLLFIAGLCTLAVNTSITANFSQKANGLAKETLNQTELLNQLLESHGNMMLAAMESLLDKDKGKILPDRLEIINREAAFLAQNSAALLEIASDDEGRKAAEALQKLFPSFTKLIQTDLKKLIETADDMDWMMRADRFNAIDEHIDAEGQAIETSLYTLRQATNQKTAAAQDALSASLARAVKFNLYVSLATLLLILPISFFLNRSLKGQLFAIIGRLSDSASELNVSADNVEAASRHLAEGTSNQAASVEETGACIEETSSMVKRNADNAQHANSLMTEMASVVREADQAMENLTSSMSAALAASEETGKIIKTIDEIAFQTNLLALNAAVEAARAGEAGAGFAVVAGEVRNLSQRAAEAARNTAALIEGTTEKIRTGAANLEGATGAFRKVSEGSGRAKTLIDEIAVASREQSQGISQINAAVLEIDHVTQQNTATSEQAAAAAADLNQQADLLLVYIDELRAIIGHAANAHSTSSGVEQ